MDRRNCSIEGAGVQLSESKGLFYRINPMQGIFIDFHCKMLYFGN
jgi:hypothetical protein